MDNSCTPCHLSTVALTSDEVKHQAERLGRRWTIVDDRHLAAEYQFANFAEGLKFVNVVGALAERVGHHPRIDLSWARVRIRLHTHKCSGLTPSDFALAALIDACDPSGVDRSNQPVAPGYVSGQTHGS